MEYKYLKARGALNESERADSGHIAGHTTARGLARYQVPPSLLELVPESVAREHRVIPLKFDGETITFATPKADDIALADKLRFLLNKNVKLVPAALGEIAQAINLNYGHGETESVDSMLQEFTDTEIDLAEAATPARTQGSLARAGRVRGAAMRPEQIKELRDRRHVPTPGLDDTAYNFSGGPLMWHYVVEEGQRVLMRRPDGSMEVVVGPKRLWHWRKQFIAMKHSVAHPGEFLIVRFRDGRQEHLPGPSDIWLDPRVHKEVTKEDALQIAAKESVVVYFRQPGSDQVLRRIEYGPALFVPKPGEWLHTFSWHSSRGGHSGAQKIPNALVFQKLWLMPDQMYHDVTDVRTADDAVLTIRLMIFFELVEIERMLDSTHDPIGDLVNAATSDVVDFCGKHDFESFKHNTDKLNELAAYKQLLNRADQCGYRINKVVYRGYGAAESLQQMHNQAIESRTKLQLERATEQQAQDLEDYKLSCQIARANKRRVEQTSEVDHDLDLARRRHEAELNQRQALHDSQRQQKRLDVELELDLRRRLDAAQQQHVSALRELGVDLTAYLTQSRADRIIEFRGASGTHVHVQDGANDRAAE